MSWGTHKVRRVPQDTFKCPNTRTFKTRLDISVLKVRRVSQDSRNIVDSLKSHVSFAEYRLFYRALLQKRPVILGSLLLSLHTQDS